MSHTPAVGLRVVVADPNLAQLADRFEAGLPAGSTVTWLSAPSTAELTAALANADVFVGWKLSAEEAAAGSRLQLIQVGGAGVDGIDRTARPDVPVANTFHHEDAMAEYALWAAIGLRRDLPGVDRELRTGRWVSPRDDPSVPLPRGLAGARIGLYGFGHIGERAWRAFRSFGATGAAVTGRGATDAAAHGLTWAGGPAELTRLCEESEILLVSAPLTEQTRGAVGTEQLAALGADGIVINLARGPVVAEEPLYRALADATIKAAAIDVWYSYPESGSDRAAPSAFDFAALPNVVMTPHISGIALSTFTRRCDEMAANLTALAEGRPLVNLV